VNKITKRNEVDKDVPSPTQMAEMVEGGSYSEYVFSESYWKTTTITSALMGNPNVLGASYICDAQYKRMAELILKNYILCRLLK